MTKLEMEQHRTLVLRLCSVERAKTMPGSLGGVERCWHIDLGSQELVLLRRSSCRGSWVMDRGQGCADVN